MWVVRCPAASATTQVAHRLTERDRSANVGASVADTNPAETWIWSEEQEE